MPARLGLAARPGRLMALAALVVILLTAAVSVVKLAGTERAPLATNGVGLGAVITQLTAAEDRLCLSDAVIPAGTGALDMYLGYHDPATPVSVRGTLTLRDGTKIAVAPTPVPAAPSFSQLALPLARTVTTDQRGRLCLQRLASGPQLDVGGATVIRRGGELPATRNGVSLEGVEPSLRMYPPAGQATSRLSLVGPAIHRLAELSPSGFPPLLIGLVLLVLAPAGLALLLWNLCTAPRRTTRRVAAWCVLGSLALTVTWATVTPVFQGPDEAEHFAYAQHLAVTGERADPSRASPRPPYSTQEVAALSILRHGAVVIDPAARNPWTATSRRDLNDTADLPRGDGGGFTESATGHSAIYYALLSPAIHLAGSSLTAELYAARLLTAMLAALIAGLAAWAAALIVPGRRRVAALGGLAAATIPIGAAVGGIVNNDALLNLVAAGAFVALLAVLLDARGPAWRYGAVAALIVLIPLVKISGTGVAVAFGGALLWCVALRLRDGLGAALRALAAAVAGVVGTLAVLAAGAQLIDGQTLTLFNTHPVVPGTAPAPGGYSRLDQLDYVLQTFVPFIHLRTDDFPMRVPLYKIYVVQSWGGFGWDRLYGPVRMYEAIGLGTLLGAAAGLLAVVRERVHLKGRWLAASAIALTPLIAIAFVAAVYATKGGRPVQPEQGRYLMVALVPLGLWFAALPGVFSPGRVRSVAIGGLAGLLCSGMAVGLLIAAAGWAV